ncbi:MAG: trans-sialidase [Nitrosopumilus sp.]|nr:trans-sialidase [Nitrosopumilus sp.]
MAAAKKQTKKDLEDKIAELEAKLNQLSDQLTKKPAETKPAEVKPAETAKPKPTLPKGSTPKPKEAPKPAETSKPKPAEKVTAPATVQDALEDAYMNAAMTDFHQYRAKVTGYTPAPNRYFVRGTAPVGKIPTKNWNDQKATVTGYTQPSNQYFATRPRLAYHPAEKRFGSFSGVAMTVDGLSVQTKPKEAPKLTPKEAEKLAKESYAAEMKAKGKGSLPKGF